MVNIIPPQRPLPFPNTTGKVNPVEKTSSAQIEEAIKEAAAPFVERRKSKEDRRAKQSNRGPFNMRSGRDRRKNQGGRSIDIEV
jgi:hypothetical protein